MTYQHTLRYLSERDTSATYMPVDPLRELIAPSSTHPVVICVSHDKCGRTVARMLRSVLQHAGVSCLHVIDSDRIEARECFVLNGSPVLPDLLCRSAEAVRDLEIRTRRAVGGKSSDAFPPSYRTATALIRCLFLARCSVLLMECDGPSPYLRALNDLSVTPSDCITLVSPTDDGGKNALSTMPYTTHSVISHACGQPLYRTLSDACARAGNLPLRIIPSTSLNSTSVTLGSQRLDGTLPAGCRIASGTRLAAKAAVLAAYAVSALRDLRIKISDAAVANGLSHTTPSACSELVSILPRLVVDRADNETELVATLEDLLQLESSLPRPRRVWLENSLLTAFAPFASFADELYTQDEPYAPDESTTTFWIGSADFLRTLGYTEGKS